METAAKLFLMVMFGVPGLAALIAIVMVWRGYVLSVMWGWFMVPGFGAQPLSIPLAIGLSMLVGTLTNHRSGDETKDPAKKWAPFFALTLGPLLMLACGWVVKQYL